MRSYAGLRAFLAKLPCSNLYAVACALGQRLPVAPTLHNMVISKVNFCVLALCALAYNNMLCKCWLAFAARVRPGVRQVLRSFLKKLFVKGLATLEKNIYFVGASSLIKNWIFLAGAL